MRIGSKVTKEEAIDEVTKEEMLNESGGKLFTNGESSSKTTQGRCPKSHLLGPQTIESNEVVTMSSGNLGAKNRHKETNKKTSFGEAEPERAIEIPSLMSSTSLDKTRQQEQEQNRLEELPRTEADYYKTDGSDHVSSDHQRTPQPSPLLSSLAPSQDTRKEVSQQSTTLDPQSRALGSHQKSWKRKEVIGLVVLALILVVVLVIIALLLVNQKDKKNMMSSSFEPTTTQPQQIQRRSSTLDRIHDRGYVICRGDPDELNQGYGFSIDMVRTHLAVDSVF